MPHDDLTQSVLTDADKAELRTVLRQLHDLVPLIEAQERCGRDCQAFRRTLEQVRQDVTNMQREFAREG